MASVSAPGTGSGIDVSSLVSRIIEAEAEPARQRFALRKAEIEARLSGLGKLQSAIAGLEKEAGALQAEDVFAPVAVSSSDETILTASGSGKAVPGRFSVEVKSLAEAQKLTSVGLADAASSVGAGTLTISGGGSSFSVSVPSGGDSLAEVRDLINQAEDNPGVRASLVTVDAAGGGTETRLVLTAADTGTSNALTVTVADSDGDDTDANGLSRLVFDPAGSGVARMTETRAAADALVEIDGAPRTSASNTIEDAIEGVTLTLGASAPGTLVTVDIEKDVSAVLDTVQGFVSAFNALRATIGQLTVFDAATGARGILLGDAGVRSLTGQLQREIGAALDIPGSSLSSLSEIGITTGADGGLVLDSAAFKAALESDPEAVAALFAGKGTGGEPLGLGRRLESLARAFTGSDGVLELRSDTLNARLRDIAEQSDRLERRMADRETRLFAQFNAMDAVVAQLQSTGDFLSQQLTALNTLGRDTRR